MRILLLLFLFGALVSASVGESFFQDRERQVRLKKVEHVRAFNRTVRPPPRRVDDLLYECDFDGLDCGVQLVGAEMTLKEQLATDAAYVFTDVTSITQPTANGETCQIPFSVNGNELYHCTYLNECLTDSGVSKCQTGKFLGGAFSQAEQMEIAYLPVFIDPFNLNLYELSFQAFMFCEGDDCRELNDVIQIDAIYFDDQDYWEMSRVLKYDDLSGKSWQKFSLNLTEIPRLLYISISFVKDFYANRESKAYYGVDEIRLRYVGNDPNRVYKCNFDSDSCGFRNGLGPSEYLTIASNLRTNAYLFTDVTSTNAPTSNGETCNLPFSLNGNLYYHCTPANECLTASGLAQCAKGRFLTGRSDSSLFGQVLGVGLFPAIRIKAFESYQVSFDAFMYCDTTAPCDAEIYFLYGPFASQNSIRLTLDDFGKEKTWKKFTGGFTATDDTMIIEIRVKMVTQEGGLYYGFDEIEVVELPKPATTTPSTTTKYALNLKKFLPGILVPSLVLLTLLILGVIVYVTRPALCFSSKMRVHVGSIPMRPRNVASPS